MKGAYNNRSDNTKIQTMRMRIGASTHTKKKRIRTDALAHKYQNANMCFDSQKPE